MGPKIKPGGEVARQRGPFGAGRPKLSQNSPRSQNRGTINQGVARTLYVRVAKRQEVSLQNAAQHPTFVVILGLISEPLVPSAPGGSGLRATRSSTIVLRSRFLRQPRPAGPTA